MEAGSVLGVARGAKEWRVADRAEALLPPVIALAIVFFTLGSSSHAALTQFALVARWPVLFGLVAVAAAAPVARKYPVRPLVPAVLAGSFVCLALASAQWSDWQRLTTMRAVSVGALFAAAFLMAWLVAGRREVAGRIVWGVVAAVTVVLAGGFLLALVYPGEAFQTTQPWRFRGLGQNPNTVPLLAAVTVPLFVWAAMTARGRRRAIAVGGLVLLVQTIFISGSRGAILAAIPAVSLQLCLARRPLRWRLGSLAILAAVAAFGLFGASLVQASVRVTGGVTIAPRNPLAPLASRDAAPSHNPCTAPQPVSSSAPAPTASSTPPQPQRPAVELVRPGEQAWLASLALVVPRPESFLHLGGRTEAWAAGVRAATKRPFFGHGFGTETDVFSTLACGMKVFNGGRVENSYLGSVLELGLLGGGLFIGLIAFCLVRGVAALRRAEAKDRDLVLALLAAVVAGALIASVQSYLYSAGNLATLPFWTCAFLLAALASRLRTAAVQ